MKRWNIRQPETDSARAISEELGIGGLVSHVLASRGIKTPQEAAEFLNAGEISDPFLIADMKKAVKIIKEALHNGEKIFIFGDYDCDGVTSTVILYQYLAAQGGEVNWYIPSRDEGYGLNFSAIDNLAEKGAKLIITVDNGTTSVDEAAYIKEKGIKLIVTDHHTAPESLPPADAVINPKRADDPSPFKELAGCGVVLKLIMAMEDDIEGVLEQFADLAAIGTIGDVVPLSSENRVIVRRGLEIMPYTENVGLYKLLRQCGFLNEDKDNSITATSLSFTVCPRINAAGRFAHAGKSAELLLAESEDLAELRSHELTTLNNNRREVENEILNHADNYFSENPKELSERVLILHGQDWHNGVIGIVSSRLLNKWGKPNIVISSCGNNDNGELVRGSARSVEGFPLVPLLEHCGEELEKFGGHVKAAGFTAKAENFPVIADKIKSYSKIHFPQMPRDVINIDKILAPEDLNLENVENLKALQPFGECNPVPVFLLQNCIILSKKPLKEGKFLTFNVRVGSVVQKILNFSCTYDNFGYENGEAVDILVSLDINEYNNVRSVSAQLKDIRHAGFNQDRHFAALDAYENLIRGEEINQRLAERAFPQKNDIKIIYDILRNSVNSNRVTVAERVFAEASKTGVNYCKFRIILDVLSEFRLIEYKLTDDLIKLLPVSEKADLESSEILGRFKALAVL
ncbi:MAG: single-stranded-DNA-specific exonuclease RecJ [Oscillospiraceae bacterium]|nr:single-stranded-DNA-specific exonuclease RecJ [Oscillospiraceae bacterium]